MRKSDFSSDNRKLQNSIMQEMSSLKRAEV